ncbi:MAG: prepilin-type N-terminal cleavage/methylation domain-containing protein, partial [Epsilonproteobacteria bacterium]|nr:prepilin-type N-terminal cleavage/methylation domain-containing protein [Campylobacterota bacterium]
MAKSKKAFTLIEVMISVMIISVVIMALLKMQGNNSHIFSKLTSKLEINQYTSFFISNNEYGFSKKSTYLDELLSEFRVEDNLRRELKNIKINIDYDELDRYGDDDTTEEQSSAS